jgi:hypothetical protein
VSSLEIAGPFPVALTLLTAFASLTAPAATDSDDVESEATAEFSGVTGF